jgi:putative flippase GtrA
MVALLARLWRFAQTPPGQRYLKYFAGSVICTLVSFVALTLAYGVFHWWTEVPSAVFANGVATIPSYYLNRNWTWGKTGRSRVWREMVPFWVTSAIGIALSMGAAAMARDFSIDHHLHHLGSTVVVDGANLLTFVVLWVAKFLVFNRLFHVGPSIDEPELAEVR